MQLALPKGRTYQEAQSEQVLNRLSKALVAQHQLHYRDIAAGLEDRPPKCGMMDTV